ncbi:MAG TPA: CoA ester lyase [Hypericibacter adhaerens]|jgi:citrate lyase subunit beta/citryl-CoA lyase|uniref:HpcH/HpaI aldolase/citrate lyase family protein n=1 Tax=Hypericibacter adhaerens TaxID=2602016 RepID=UPI002BF3417D|nr:CoA ester lyase [Hypericibacter adhaerens]HWA44389.1 CoA ester lyase [Hypericibacter adhaerens]
MFQSTRPRRSALYTPGSNLRALEKGKTLPADVLIMDLEDAVAPEAKRDARIQVVNAVKAGGYGAREVVIRVNGLNTPWGYGDLAAVAEAGAAAILIPKVESVETVRQAETVLVANSAPEDLALWCMMETPRAMLNVEEIAGSSRRVQCFVMGTSDLTKDLHAVHTRDRLPLVTSLGLCMLAARAYGLAILDGVHLDLDDDAGFEAACRQGAEMGFDGKTLIHPKTIAAANTAFAPAPAEVEWSRRIIAAHADAVAGGRGIVVLDGKLIENLHVLNARRIVELAEAIAAREGGDGAR